MTKTASDPQTLL